jgi:Zn-dependent M28 family amino/carboxypeptidase
MDRHTRHTAEALELSISSIPVMFRATDPFARSDQIAFAQAGIPSMLIMEGVQWRHKSREQGLQEFIDWGRTRYHTPFDDLSQPIDYDAVRQHIQIVLALAGTLADTFTPPQWLPGAPYIHARLQSMAEKR